MSLRSLRSIFISARERTRCTLFHCSSNCLEVPDVPRHITLFITEGHRGSVLLPRLAHGLSGSLVFISSRGMTFSTRVSTPEEVTLGCVHGAVGIRDAQDSKSDQIQSDQIGPNFTSTFLRPVRQYESVRMIRSDHVKKIFFQLSFLDFTFVLGTLYCCCSF